MALSSEGHCLSHSDSMQRNLLQLLKRSFKPVQHTSSGQRHARRQRGISSAFAGILQFVRARSTAKSSCVGVTCCVGTLNSLAGGPEDLVLGIETSCDDTGVAVVSTTGRVLSDALVSQVSACHQHAPCTNFLLVSCSMHAVCRLMCMQPLEVLCLLLPWKLIRLPWTVV